MIVFPAVDILGGRCVQLVQGRRETATDFGTPGDCARRWMQEGARHLHIINLDGAFGDSRRNAAVLREMINEIGIPVQLGGGIRSFEDAAGWLDLGVERVILGTSAVREPDLISRLADRFGSRRVMAGVDARQGKIAVEGWEKTAGDYIDWGRTFADLGAGSLLYTNVDVEGLQRGISPDPVARLIESVSIPVVVAGGVSSPADITVLKAIGAHGIVLGSALYSGKLSLREALEAADEDR
ncbi:MAG: 1-(5-phosphoribosyl)-5-[(5-phosphoribosylamino)methylideneamino]imidazole-4-carboxamide isomerase [Methanomicrobiales archaeon]|nr:1-(5-phosphoribosyl)-5-[(5-phosphoribosylamino)methylideneamino]imidazole-4-carboxamide isomerase [Methanomicrobiales archaeon]